MGFMEDLNIKHEIIKNGIISKNYEKLWNKL